MFKVGDKVRVVDFHPIEASQWVGKVGVVVSVPKLVDPLNGMGIYYRIGGVGWEPGSPEWKAWADGTPKGLPCTSGELELVKEEEENAKS